MFPQSLMSSLRRPASWTRPALVTLVPDRRSSLCVHDAALQVFPRVVGHVSPRVHADQPQLSSFFSKEAVQHRL